MECDEPEKLLLEQLNACPVQTDNPQDCPLYMVRTQKPEQQLDWVQKLTGDEVNHVLDYCDSCYARQNTLREEI